MKKIFLSLVISTLLLGMNFCYGMELQKGSGSSTDQKQRSKSHIVKRDKQKDAEAAARRRSLASPLELVRKPDEDQVPRVKPRTFSLLSQLKLKSKSKSAESGIAAAVQSASVPTTAHASISEGQAPDNLSTLLVLSRPVVTSVESAQSQPPAGESKAATSSVQKRNVEVQVPISKNELQQTIFEPREVQVSPAKVEPAPAMNPAQERLVRRASLLRTVYVTGQKSSDGRAELKRSGRDSMTEQSAIELLGKNGTGALCANPSPSQSPRSDDNLTPRSEEVTPCADDAASPRSGEDTPSPRVDEALSVSTVVTSNGNLKKTE